MKKYGFIISSEWKNSLAYRGDTWLTAIFSVFAVVLAYLLWSAVFGGADTLNGFTLQQMTTYYLLAGMLAPLTQSDGLLQDFAVEIRGGGYAKYLVKPLSPLGYFLAASLARALLPLLASITVLSIARFGFADAFAVIHLVDILQALPLIMLGSLFSMLTGHIIAMTTFTLTDVEFIYVLQNVIKAFLSGAVIPLNMVFGDSLPLLSPFSYLTYYPVLLCLGKTEIPPLTAACVLTGWVLAALALCLVLQKQAPRRFEGVGL